ncbi:MAG: hypothetical protein ACK56I_34140, partial [bacterium]
VVRRRRPVDDAVVLVDVRDATALRRRRLVHDVDVDPLLAGALGVPHRHLVLPGLLPLRVDHVQLDAIAVERQVDVLADLEDLAVLLDDDLQIGLLLALHLVGDGHVALLLGDAGDGAAVAHLGRLLALHHGEVGLG